MNRILTAGKLLFISRAGADAAVAEQIARILEAAGYEVILAQRDFANRNFIERMHEALSGGARVVALLSADYMKSDYCLAEWSNGIAGDPLNRKRRLIVLRIGPCEPAGLLAGLAYADLVPFRNDPQRFASAVLDAVRGGGNTVAPELGQRYVPPRRSIGLTPAVAAVLAVAIAVAAGVKLWPRSGAAVTPPALSRPAPDLPRDAQPRGGTVAESDGLVRTVREYYAGWNDRRLPEMWSLLSPAFRARTDYTTWAQAHSMDKAIRVASARVVAADTVATTVIAIEDTASGGVTEKTYHVTWHLISENGRWLLDSYLQF